MSSKTQARTPGSAMISRGSMYADEVGSKRCGSSESPKTKMPGRERETDSRNVLLWLP